MASLSAHFTRPDEHDRLRFHPQCPRCRAERLEGSLMDGPLVPLRAQAAIAVGVLACTSLAPAAAFATGVDDEIEGTAAPGQLAPDMEAEGELDATAESEPEPTDVPGQPTEPVAADETSDESAPQPQSEEPEPSVPAASDTVPEVPDQQPTGAVESAPAPTTALQPSAEPAADEAPGKWAERERAKSRALAKSEVRRAKRTTKVRVVKRQTRVAPAATPTPAVAAAPVPAATTAPAPRPRTVAVAASATREQAAEAGDGSHVVQQGESLWSIAADVLPDGASPAQVAREVNRLWERNQSQIGTGDRNLVKAGTWLEL